MDIEKTNSLIAGLVAENQAEKERTAYLDRALNCLVMAQTALVNHTGALAEAKQQALESLAKRKEDLAKEEAHLAGLN